MIGDYAKRQGGLSHMGPHLRSAHQRRPIPDGQIPGPIEFDKRRLSMASPEGARPHSAVFSRSSRQVGDLKGNGTEKPASRGAKRAAVLLANARRGFSITVAAACV